MLKRAFPALLSMVLWTGLTAHAQGPSCVDVFRPLESRMAQFDPGLYSMFQRFQRLDPSLISGERTPTWRNLDQLQQMIKALRLIKGAARSPEATAELNEIIAQLTRGAAQDPALSSIANARRTHYPSKTYRPTEYELKLDYQFLIGKLNRELPRDLRIPLQRLPVDLRRSRINRDAREFMTEFLKDFDARFANSEFKSYEAYEKAIRSNPDPAVQKAIELIDKGQIEVVIRRPLGARFWVPKVGFQNQYITNSSRGSLDRDGRQRAEARLYGLERTVGESAVATYKQQDAEFMPKYATLRPSPDSGIQYDARGSGQYGPDFYVIRLSDVQDRLT